MEETKQRFRKIGGGSFRLARGKIIKPNEVFSAYPSEIPEAFRDVIVPVDGEIRESTPVEDVGEKYHLVHKGRGWYDIVNTASGKAINDHGLREAEAKEKLESLS